MSEAELIQALLLQKAAARPDNSAVTPFQLLE